MTPRPNLLAIAGVDPSGGAGLLADLKTFTALGGFGCGVVTALTAQNTQRVTAIHTPPVAFLAAQLETLLTDVPIAASKTGMLGTAEVIETVATQLARSLPKTPLVVDPVMIATSGDSLLEPDAVAALQALLLPLATVITPNLPEAAALTGLPEATTLAEMRRTAERLRALMAPSPGRWVLLKGGNLPGETLVDLAFDGETVLTFRAPRRPAAFHGTGCTLAAAVTAHLGFWWQGQNGADAFLDAAAAAQLFGEAHAYLHAAVAHAGEIVAGRGAQPLHHGYAIAPQSPCYNS